MEPGGSVTRAARWATRPGADVSNPKLDTAIVGGLVVDSSAVRRLDIGIRDGVVADRVAAIDPLSTTRVIDARGRYVLPGAIDAHFHPQYGDNLETGSLAAAYGGITTLVAFVYAYKGLELGQAIDEFLAGDGSRSVLDFALHIGLVNPADTVEQIPDAASRGVRSFKFFLAYRKRGMMIDDDQFMRALELVAGVGGITMVHAENGLAIDYLENKFLASSRTGVEWFEPSRPKRLEYEAVFRAIQLAAVTECPLYLVHQTTAEGAAMVARARSDGQFVIGETCPQYLLWTNDDLVRYGPVAVLAPPYRTVEDQDSLWSALAAKEISVVGSDHAPHDKRELENVFSVPVGTAQVETMLPLLFDRGVNAGRITVQRLVAALCENPARAFGVFPRKGCLEPGSDADVVIVDPNLPMEINAERLHSSMRYPSIYEGWQTLGRPVHTLQRGRDVLVDGAVVREPSDGVYMEAGPPTQTI
jgi:dihydropyrimidinase